jgi:hypothetical protein
MGKEQPERQRLQIIWVLWKPKGINRARKRQLAEHIRNEFINPENFCPPKSANTLTLYIMWGTAANEDGRPKDDQKKEIDGCIERSQDE